MSLRLVANITGPRTARQRRTNRVLNRTALSSSAATATICGNTIRASPYIAKKISRRKWKFWILVWVKDNRLTEIQREFIYMEPDRSSDIVYHPVTVQTRVSRRDPELCQNPFYRLHHLFAVYPDGSRFWVWVDPTAIRERELLSLNFDCALSIAGCRYVADLAPAAWRVYKSDQELLAHRENNGPVEAATDSDCH